MVFQGQTDNLDDISNGTGIAHVCINIFLQVRRKRHSILEKNSVEFFLKKLIAGKLGPNAG